MPNAIKLVHSTHLGNDVRLGGRRRPKHLARSVKLEHILGATPVTPPSSTNNRAKADAALKQMYLNDQLGDCVIAGRYHRLGLLTGAATGKAFIATRAQILADYERIGGYSPSDPNSDQGCDMTVAANDGVTHGYADGSKDVGWISIDPTNKSHVMLAIYLFEVGDVGVELPDEWVNPFPSGDGFTWDVAGDPDPSNGHCYEIVDYDANLGVYIETWGMGGWETWAALAKYTCDAAGGELQIHLNQDQLDKAMAKAPNGLDWATLIAAFNAQGGHVPVPTPPPAPSPTPVPPPVPTPPVTGSTTLAEAQSLVTAAFSHYHRNELGTNRAVKIATDALAAGWKAGK